MCSGPTAVHTFPFFHPASVCGASTTCWVRLGGGVQGNETLLISGAPLLLGKVRRDQEPVMRPWDSPRGTLQAMPL